MYHAQFPDRQRPDHRSFQRLHHQLRETRSFHVTRHEVGQRSLEESILNVVADRLQTSTRAVAHHVHVSYQTVCRVLNENRLHPYSASTSFKPGRLFFPTTNRWYIDLRCSCTS
ncbi:hypothetical protein TNCV_3348531 [Trichonephila clavipes]|nr:hypothetical protein TNCV_3348531 [Trichonephila clavipes]